MSRPRPPMPKLQKSKEPSSVLKDMTKGMKPLKKGDRKYLKMMDASMGASDNSTKAKGTQTIRSRYKKRTPKELKERQGKSLRKLNTRTA